MVDDFVNQINGVSILYYIAASNHDTFTRAFRKIPKRLSEAVNRRRTNNTMTK
jgi:hypothetical protein